MMKKKAMRLDCLHLIEVIKKTPLVSIDLIIRNKLNEVLLGLRNNEPAKNFWFVPGGRILINERISNALERIAYDEIGINLTFNDTRFLGVFEHFYQENFAQEQGFGTHYVVLAYEINISKSLHELPKDQHRQYRWLKVESLLKEDKVHPNTKAYFIPPTLLSDS